MNLIAPPKIDFKQTISRDLTHKRRIENVYVTAMDRLSDSEFFWGAFIPQANVYLNAMRSSPNDVTLTILEIGRQVGIALCHGYMGVEKNNAFILNTMYFETTPVYYGTDWSVNDKLQGTLTTPNKTYTINGGLRTVHGEGLFYINDSLVCRQWSDWTIQPVDRYHRFRRIVRDKNAKNPRPAIGEEYLPPFEAFKIKSNAHSKISVLNEALWVGMGSTTFATTLRIDYTNQFFFDHENDHVPGMLMLEGMRELAVDIASRFPHFGDRVPQITKLGLAFKNFAELDYPVELVAQIIKKPNGEDKLELVVETRQFGKVVADGRFTIE